MGVTPFMHMKNERARCSSMRRRTCQWRLGHRLDCGRGVARGRWGEVGRGNAFFDGKQLTEIILTERAQGRIAMLHFGVQHIGLAI